MKKPKKSPAILRAMQEIKTTAEQNGHSLREWKWDGCGYWRTDCDNRNCVVLVWVATDGSSGGSGIGEECWIRAFNKRMGRQTS